MKQSVDIALLGIEMPLSLFVRAIHWLIVMTIKFILTHILSIDCCIFK